MNLARKNHRVTALLQNRQTLQAGNGHGAKASTSVMKWARHETQRHMAQHLSGLRNDDYETQGTTPGSADPTLSERRTRRARKMSSRELRRLIAEVVRGR